MQPMEIAIQNGAVKNTPYSHEHTNPSFTDNAASIEMNGVDKLAKELVKLDTEEPTETPGVYAWMSVFVSFLILVIVDGIIQCFGGFLIDLMMVMDTTAFNVMLCGVLLNGISNIFGPISAAFINHCGARNVLIFGTLISSSAIYLGSIAPNIFVFNIVFGGFGAIGFSFMLLTAYTLPSVWFHRKRALVSGMSLAGSGASYFVFAPMIDRLIDLYSVRGALKVLSAVNLNGLVLAACIWQWKIPKKQKEIEITLEREVELTKNLVSVKTTRIWKLKTRLKRLFSVYLFKKLSFYQIVFSSMCYCLVGYSAPQIFKDYSRMLNIPRSVSSMLLSIMGIVIVFLKITVGIFANYIRKPLIIYVIGGVILATVTGLLPFIPFLYYAFTIIYSCGSSLYLSMQTSVIAQVLGYDNITSTMGYIFFIQGITILTVIPSFLYINVLTGNYTATLVSLGVITMFGVLAMLPFLRPNRQPQLISS